MESALSLFRRRRDEIFDVLRLYSAILNMCPDFIGEEDVLSLAGPLGEMSPEQKAAAQVSAVYGMILAAGGLAPEEDPHHRVLAKEYIWPSLAKLQPSVYKDNAYCCHVPFPSVTKGRWTLCERSYAPYELFVRGADTGYPDGREVPSIGFFDTSFSFPAVLENGREWMTVTPNEIETMKEPLAKAEGKVLTLGLGLGYFAFMAAEKDTVESVTVVERDETVISLFAEHLLPHFPNGRKIRIQKGDALAYLDGQARRESFDFAFADLWHDASDGVPLYLAIKKREASLPFLMSYWIEGSLLSHIRWRLFADFEKSGRFPDDMAAALTDTALARAVALHPGRFASLFHTSF